MKYIYKTVMLNQFSHSEAGKKYLARGLSLDINDKIGEMIQALLNHYAEDGWEYWRNDTFQPIFFQSISSMLFSLGAAAELPPIPVFIFRKEFTEELKKQFKEEEKRELEEALKRAAHNDKKPKREMPEVIDARCPNCESPVNMLDERCWKCDASFGGLSTWRPQPI